MDWGSVTEEDLMDALLELDWAMSSPPRPLNEFFSKFALPRSYSKWNSRMNCNLYYYATNYLLMFIFLIVILEMESLRRPLGMVAVLLTAISIAFLSDSFFNVIELFVKHVIRVRPLKKRAIHMCGGPGWMCVAVFAIMSASCSLSTFLWALLIGILATVLHAGFRTRNLKAHLNNEFRSKFRAFRRNFSEL
ncbi:hypothetical protein MKW94_024857 [Papaver nudicaule]|uniref:PRA1 family protein n=1 Tax=Papaver nudicaule TaxID=74823 RepID=A0AA41VBP6_PAPNU|nr:hypothetical protein [Papaver nudicaule]